MKILVVSNAKEFEELHEKFGNTHDLHLAENQKITSKDYDLIFDFSLTDDPERLQKYKSIEIPLFIHALTTPLQELKIFASFSPNNVFGFNGLPTFINRPIFEVSCLPSGESALNKICESLKTEFQQVDDRVGMVTPRIVAMIINEAYYTAQEGTATRQDIDLGMKLGTNYPKGPFEWCQAIGIEKVYELLEALYEDTKEERYKICPLLKKEYLTALAN